MLNADAAFSALADPTRREIMTLLGSGEKSLSEITPHFDMSRPAVSKHVRILEGAGLIQISPKGRRRIHRLNPKGLQPVSEWIGLFDAFWDDRLAALKSTIEGENT